MMADIDLMRLELTFHDFPERHTFAYSLHN